MVSEQTAQQIVRETIARVDTKRDYNIAQMVRENFFPWHKDRRSYRKAVIIDMSGPNLLQVNIIGEGKGRDYTITGKSIVRYLKTIGYAMVLTNKTLYATEPPSTQTRVGRRTQRRTRKNSNQN
jgi:hypothetical protein